TSYSKISKELSEKRRPASNDEESILESIFYITCFIYLFLASIGCFLYSKAWSKKRAQCISKIRKMKIEWAEADEVEVKVLSPFGRLRKLHCDYKWIKVLGFVPVNYLIALSFIGTPARVIKGPKKYLGMIVPTNLKEGSKKGRLIENEGEIF